LQLADKVEKKLGKNIKIHFKNLDVQRKIILFEGAV